MEPAIIWGIFYKAMGIVYLIAIAQLYPQVLLIAGTQGISPVHEKLKQIKRDYPGWRKWIYFPTLLWINSSDRFLKGLVILGTLSSLVVIYGGPYAGIALLICWIIYLSLDIALGFTYPWDCVLLEAGFLAIFLPSVSSLPDMHVNELPHPLVAWMFRILLFRVLFGFGKFKFWKSNLKDRGYFRAFMMNIPLPALPAWFLFRFPGRFFQFILLFSFVVEIIVPFFIFSSSELRIVAAILITVLMIGIQVVSNFGFFNILTIVLCIPLLDIQSSLFDLRLEQLYSPYGNTLLTGVMLILFVGGFLNFFFNSWCTFTWLHWPSALHIKSKFISKILDFYRLILRFRITHSYGVFPPKSTPGMKLIPVIEGSKDGITWKHYEYKYLPTHEKSFLRHVAPYHPRLDHAIFYDAFGTNDANFTWSIMGNCNPYDFKHSSGMEAIMQRLLEGNGTTHKLFRSVPFAPSDPPVFIRANLYRLEPTTWKERKRTGNWFTKKFAATHIEERSIEKDYWTKREIVPELFHWDAYYHKNRSPHIQNLNKAAASGLLEKVYKASDKEVAFSSDHFFTTFLKTIQADERNWKVLPKLRQEAEKKYSYLELKDIEIVWSRLSIMLAHRLHPYFLDQQQPKLAISKYFHFGLFVHHIVGKGKAAYEYVFNDPAKAHEFLDDFTLEKGFYFYGFFRLNTLIYQSRKFRWSNMVMTPDTNPVLPGFVDLMDFVSKQFKELGKECWPLMKMREDGEWIITEIEDKNNVLQEEAKS